MEYSALLVARKAQAFSVAYMIASALVCLLGIPSARIWAAEESSQQINERGASQSPSSGAPPGELSTVTGALGIQSHLRAGHWAQLLLSGIPVGAVIQVESLDGDGVRVVQVSEVKESPARVYLPCGTKGSFVEVYLLDPANERKTLVWQTRLLDGVVDGRRIWVVAIGDTLGLDAIGRSELLGTEGEIAVALVEKSDELPADWFGYDGVDGIVVSGASTGVLQSMSSQQRKAFQDWIAGGGEVLISLGEDGVKLVETVPWFAEMIGVRGEVESTTVDPSALESFVSARTPTSPFGAVKLSPEKSSVVLLGKGLQRESIPLLVTQQVGFGRLTIFAGGLDRSPLLQWKQREDFIIRSIPSWFSVKKEDRSVGNQGRDVRYEELVGQVRATMDQFVSRSAVPFSVVAVLMLVLIGLIGPVDFFLVNRWLGRPLLGWLTFPLAVGIFTAGFLFWRGQADAEMVRQLTVVDIDPASGFGRGFSWTQVYSGKSHQGDYRVLANGRISGLDAVGTLKSQGALTGPWGYSGREFGGIEIAGEDVRLPAYRMVFEGSSTELAEVPFAPRSSKSLASRWNFSPSSIVTSDLFRRPGSDLLGGAFSNPLPVDLLDSYLIYRNLVYVLPTRIRTGDMVGSVDTMQPKNFRWRLNRRTSTETNSQSQPWDPSQVSDLGRLMEIVMFYDAAGGEKYAGLSNRMLHWLDLSRSLTEDQAILVGRLEASEATLSEVQLEVGEDENGERMHQTYVRVLLPVGSPKGSNESRENNPDSSSSFNSAGENGK